MTYAYIKARPLHCLMPAATVIVATACQTARPGDSLALGAQHTSIRSAFGRHVSAALPCPNTVRLWGWDGLSARTAARLISCVDPQPHPHALNTLEGGLQALDQEPKTMTTSKAGPAGVAASAGRYIPRHYLRRLAYTLAGKATRREALRARAFELVAADRIGGVR